MLAHRMLDMLFRIFRQKFKIMHLQSPWRELRLVYLHMYNFEDFYICSKIANFKPQIKILYFFDKIKILLYLYIEA